MALSRKVIVAPLIITFPKWFIVHRSHRLTFSRLQVDSSPHLNEVLVMSSPLWANSFEGLLSCLLLQYFAKWFIFPERVQRLPNPRQFLATHWCGQCFPQLKQSLVFLFLHNLVHFLFDSDFCWHVLKPGTPEHPGKPGL